MVWITLLVASLFSGTITGFATSEGSYPSNAFEEADLSSVFLSALRDFASCRSLTLCQLVERFKEAAGNSSGSSWYQQKEKSSRRAKRFYGNYGPPASHPYYPAFDPISVLASLAFLAFLLQSFASLFDRARSIIPAIVNSRGSSEADVQDVAKSILQAVDDYELLNENSSEMNYDGNKD